MKPRTSDALMSRTDLPASFATLTGQTVPEGRAPDSENLPNTLFATEPDQERARDAVKQPTEVLVEVRDRDNDPMATGFMKDTMPLDGGIKTDLPDLRIC
jgi:hypothetical protein